MDIIVNIRSNKIQKNVSTENKIDKKNILNILNKEVLKIDITENPVKKAVFLKKANEKKISNVDNSIKPDEKLKNNDNKSVDKSIVQNYDRKSNKTFKKASLVLDTDCQIRDMEAFLGSSKGTKFEPVFSNNSFEKFNTLHSHLIKTLSDRMNITIATAIQDKAIPALLDGRDALIKSATGSGKTLSYAIPMVNSLQSIMPPIKRTDGIHAIVVSPTRELAVQTHEVLIKLTNPYVRIVTGTLIGGEKADVQKRALKKGLNILIVTPNRFIHHLKVSKLDLQHLKWLIIDEADRITELGFAENIKKIIEEIKTQKSIQLVQTVLLSATLSPGVENLAGLALKDAVRAEVDFIKTDKNEEVEDISKGECSNFVMPSGLEHFLLVCPTKLRMVALISFLLLKCKYGRHTGKVVVFMATQDLVEFHFQLFTQFLKEKTSLEELPNAEENNLSQNSNIDIFQLHGGMEHNKRQEVFKKFTACKNGFLLTTDICARGLDMIGISWVVQYHPPGNPVDYIHRVGRTARAGNKGKALLFLQPAELNYVEHLRTSVGGLNISKVALSSVLKAALSHATKIKQRKSPIHTVEESIFLTAKILEQHVSNDTILQNLARTAYKSLVGSYATFSKEMRQFFCYKDLHLGHVAKSMACTEKPTEISQRAQRNVLGDLKIDKRKKVEEKSKKRKSSDPSKERITSKKPKMDMAHRNMMAEFGL